MARWWLVVGSLLGLVLACLLGLYAVIRDELPDQIASHWGTDGVDDTSSPRAFLLVIVVLLVGLCVFQGLLAAFLPVEGRRIMGVACCGLAGLIGLGMGGSLWDQRGLTDPYAAPEPGRWLALGFAAAVPLAVLAWRLLPTFTPSATGATGATGEAGPTDDAGTSDAADARLGADDAPAGSRPLDLGRTDAAAAGVAIREGADHERAEGLSAALRTGEQWSAAIPAGIGNWVVVGLLIVLGAGLALTPARWVALPVLLVVAVIVALMSRARLVVDDESVRVSSFGRVTWLRAPLRTIRSADVEPVRPLAEFGGYGLRYGFRGRGFVTVSGPALHLRAPGGSDTWITCDDAALAARVVNDRLARLSSSR